MIAGEEVELKNVRDAIKRKLAYVTEDRKGNGLILSNPIKINTTLANLDSISARGVIDKDKEYQAAVEYKEKLNTKCPTVEQNVGNLSGGNQQKVLLAKWMFADPDVLILDEPTRGIDVGAKYEIYCIINSLVAEGKSVIMISSELPEVLGMCDRIYVMNEGKMVGGNEKATKLSGINTDKVYFIAYLNMGFLSALAGMLTIARMTSAQPTYGQNYEMDAIGSCFIGGASAYGGVGTVPSVIVGAILMGVINLGMSIMGVDANYQRVVKGLVLLAAVIFDVVSKKEAQK